MFLKPALPLLYSYLAKRDHAGYRGSSYSPGEVILPAIGDKLLLSLEKQGKKLLEGKGLLVCGG